MDNNSRSIYKTIIAISLVVLLLGVPASLSFLPFSTISNRAFAQSAIPSTANWNKYVNSTMGVQISYPTDWMINSTYLAFENTISFFALSDLTGHNYPTHVNFVEEKLNNSVTLDQFGSVYINYRETADPDFHIIQNLTTGKWLAGNPAHEIIYSSYVNTPAFTGEVQGWAIWSINGNRAYLMQAVTDKSKASDYEPSFTAMFSSLIATTLTPLSPRVPVLASYSDNKLGYSIQYDKNWQVESSSDGVSFYSPYHGYFFNNYATARVFVGNVTGGETLDSYQADTVNFYNITYDSFSYSWQPVTLSGDAGRLLVINYKTSSAETFEAYREFALANGKSYEFAFIVSENISGDYAAQKNAALSSFHIPTDTSPPPTYATSGGLPEFLTYNNTDYGFSIQYPSTWSKYQPPDFPVGFEAPLDNANDVIRESVLVSVQDLTYDISLYDYSKSLTSEIEQSQFLSNVTTTGSQLSSLGGYPGQQLQLSGYSRDGTRVTVFVIWTIVEKRVYVVMFVGEFTKYGSLYAPILQQMVHSFKIDTNQIETGFDLYSSKELGMQLQYPGDWHVHKTSEFGSPSSVTFTDASSPRIFNIAASPVFLNMTAKEFADVLPYTLADNFDGFKLVDTAGTTLGGFPAYKVVFSAFVKEPTDQRGGQNLQVAYNVASMQNSDAYLGTAAGGGLQVKGAVIVAVRNGIAYMATYATSVADYLDYLPTANQLVGSVQIIPQDISTKLSGSTISDKQSGLTINLPDGWTGYKQEIGNFTSYLAYAPQSPDHSSKATLYISIKDLGKALNEKPRSGRHVCGPVNETHIFTENGGLSLSKVNYRCDMFGLGSEVIEEYHAFTSDLSISIGLIASDNDTRESVLPQFKQSIKSISLPGSIDAFRPGHYDKLFGDRFYNQTVSAKNGTYTVALRTSSANLTDFAFDEGRKQISFRVSGEHGTSGSTTVLLSSVLRDNLSVTIDGEPTKNYTVEHYDDTNETSITVNYMHSTHSIVITGEQVVPEFPSTFTTLLVTSALGAMVIIGRHIGQERRRHNG
ncbi:MAG: hypothetical protein ABI361_07225 [Nitrososphaera sp.]